MVCHRSPMCAVTSTACPSEMFYSEEAGKSGGGALSANKQVVPSGFKTITRLLWNKFIRQKNNRKKIPVGKCSLTGQLSTCKVAFPPFLVKRTRWYLPSFTAVVVSLTLMSTVPMLNVTPTLPCSWERRKSEER